MTALTSPPPIAQVARIAPAASRAGSLAASPASTPALALQSTVAATSFADLLSASSHQPAPVPSPSPSQAPVADHADTAQADADAGSRRAHLPAAAPAHTTQTAAAEDAAPADDGVDPSVAATPDAAEADQGAPVADAAAATPTHRTRKSSNGAATDVHAAVAAAAQTVAPTAPRAAEAAVQADDAAPATGGPGAGGRVSHGVIAVTDAGGAAGAADATSTQARQAVLPDQTVALGGEPAPGAAAAAAAADADAALATAIEAAGPTGGAGSVAGIGALGNAGAAGAASAASLVDLHAAATPAASDTQVAIATPTDAPDFREALGAQVSVLVQDGVQTAELHLNPADMGPISVRIAMDGAQAKIDFGADSADTRRLIETGLPELASALRDAGFTLSGGGVSDHRQGRPDGDGGRTAVQRVAADGGDAGVVRRAVNAASLRRTAGTGGLDLYA